MERLTFVTEDGDVLFHTEDLPDDEGVTITQLAVARRFRALETIAERLANREQAEQQGLLLRLPCKVGDIAYEITGATTRGYDWKYLTYEKAYIHGTVFNLSRLHDIGKTIFLTKEEAEEKLKELKEMEGAE